MIGIVDTKVRPRTRSRLLEALVDETAHVATALLLLGALDAQSMTNFGLAAALGGVLIDVDHVPMEFWRWDILTRTTGRPYPHSLAAFLGAMTIAYRLPAQYRRIGGAVIVGFAAHLARDLATGGIPLLWPVTAQQVRVPYRLYALLLALAASLIVWRECPSQQTTSCTPQEWEKRL